MLYEHKNRVCGKWTLAQEDKYGLRLEGVVENNKKNTDIVNKILTGKINGLSIGFYLLKAHKLNDTRYIKEAELIECSLVERPANALRDFSLLAEKLIIMLI